MSNKKYWFRGGLTYLIQNIVTVLIGFFSFVFLVRILEPNDYGAWTLFLSVVGILEITRNGLTHEALVKFLAAANEEEDKKHIISGTFLINFISTIIIILIVIIIGPLLSKLWHSPEMTLVLNIYIIGFILTGFINQFNCIEQANFGFKGIFYSNIVRQLIFFGFVMFCFLVSIKTNIVLLAWMQILSIVVSFLISYVYSKKFIVYTKKVSRIWLKKIFDFGKYTFGVSLSAVLSSSVDQMMLGSMLSKAASGTFNIAVRITNLASIPTNSVAAIVYPHSSRIADSEGPGSLKYMYEKSVGVILSILFPCVVFLWVFADYIIPIIASEKYVDAIPLLKITLLSSILYPYTSQTGIILTSAGKTKFNFYLILFNFLTIVIFNVIFIKLFGIIGAAYSTLLSAIFSVGIAQLYLHRIYKINFFKPWVYGYHFYGEFWQKYIKERKNS